MVVHALIEARKAMARVRLIRLGILTYSKKCGFYQKFFAGSYRVIRLYMEKALVFWAAAHKACTSFYDDPISDSPSASGTEPFNV
jgi:hypothetical protein